MESVGYIEYRVYLSGKVVDVQEIADAAEDLKDEICDILSDEMSPIFTQDVTYEVKFGKE
ncbi:MAG: hypothetical protein ABWY25_01505 [Paenisporosarcina sp.]